MSAAHALRTALQHHRAGRLAEAEVTYREVLRLEPENAEALHLLGMLCQQSGRNEEAIQLLRKAVELRPDAAIYRSNLAGILGKVRQVLRPDGYLFLGGAETTLHLDDAFERVQLGQSGCYQLHRR